MPTNQGLNVCQKFTAVIFLTYEGISLLLFCDVSHTKPPHSTLPILSLVTCSCQYHLGPCPANASHLSTNHFNFQTEISPPHPSTRPRSSASFSFFVYMQFGLHIPTFCVSATPHVEVHLYLQFKASSRLVWNPYHSMHKCAVRRDISYLTLTMTLHTLRGDSGTVRNAWMSRI